MEFAGHADLSTIFSSYIHVADLVASHQLQQAKISLPLDVVNKLIGISRMELKQHNSLALESRDNKVHLNQIRPYVNRKIECKKLAFTHKVKAPYPTSHNSNTIKKQSSAVFGSYSREMIEKLLCDIEDKQTLGEASSLNFRYDDALMICERALSLVKNDDGTLNHKLISKRRKQRSDHVLISPTPLHYHKEQALVHQCFDNLEALYTSKISRREIKQILEVFYEKTNTSKSEIRFSLKQEQLFYSYLKTMCRILPSRHWRVNVNCIESEPYIHEKNKKAYRPVVNKAAQLKRIEEFKKKVPSFEGEVTSINTHNGYALTVISPLKQKSKSKLSSALMSYVLHLLLVVEKLSD